MKRLSKSAGDISPCKRKTRSNSFDEYQDELDQESPLDKCRTDVRYVFYFDSNYYFLKSSKYH